MAEHSVFPINWFELNTDQIISYLEYKEYQEYKNERGEFQIINECKTVKTFAKAYGIDAKLWGYIPLSPAKPNSPNSNPNRSRSRNALVHVSICDCFRKQL